MSLSTVAPRYIPAPRAQYDGTCRHCTAPLPRGRRLYCGSACEVAWKVPRGREVRARVFQRDFGCCAGCACDTEALRVAVRWFERRDYLLRVDPMRRSAEPYRVSRPRLAGDDIEPGVMLVSPAVAAFHAEWVRAELLTRRRVEAFLRDRGFPADASTWWEADHLVPVARGGGACSLENLRTLCLPCHRTVTLNLVGELASERRRTP